MRNEKMLIILICLVLILGAGCSAKEETDSRVVAINKLVSEGKYKEAKIKTEELFNKDEEKYQVIMDNLDSLLKFEEDQEEISKKFAEIKNQYEKPILEIQSNHTDKIKDGYIYITGRVKNISDTDIEYFEVVCKFLDKDGQVLDSDYTNDGLILKSGEMREFEIMHKYKSEYDSYSLSIGEVK